MAAGWRRAFRSSGGRAARRLLILLYHRVGEVGVDPWALAVTPEHLAEHLEVLRRSYRVVPLHDLTRVLDRGKSERSVAITVDDGYHETLVHLRASLGRAGSPATVFLPTGAIGRDREFWWDELERVLLQPGRLPRRLELPIRGRVHRWDLGHAADYDAMTSGHHHLWMAWDEPLGSRQAIYRALYDLLLPLRDVEQRSVLNRLLDWADLAPAARPSHCCLNMSDAQVLAQDTLIEIGAHTITHPVLSALPAPDQRDEILLSKTHLETLLGRPVTSFAYPYGRPEHYTPQTVLLVRQVGFARACANLPGLAMRATDRFQLPRVQVHDWDAEEFSQRLLRWFDGIQ